MGSTSRRLLHVSTEKIMGYVLQKKPIKLDLVRSVSERRERAVETNPANSTRLRVLFNRLYNYNNETAIKYSLREHSH